MHIHLFYTFLHNSSEGMFLCLPDELNILSAFIVCHIHSVTSYSLDVWVYGPAHEVYCDIIQENGPERGKYRVIGTGVKTRPLFSTKLSGTGNILLTTLPV